MTSDELKVKSPEIFNAVQTEDKSHSSLASKSRVGCGKFSNCLQARSCSHAQGRVSFVILKAYSQNFRFGHESVGQYPSEQDIELTGALLRNNTILVYAGSSESAGPLAVSVNGGSSNEVTDSWGTIVLSAVGVYAWRDHTGRDLSARRATRSELRGGVGESLPMCPVSLVSLQS